MQSLSCGSGQSVPNFDPPPDARNLQVRDDEPCMLNDRSSAKVGLWSLEGIGTGTRCASGAYG